MTTTPRRSLQSPPLAPPARVSASAPCALLVALAVLTLLAACDNIGRAFDNDVDPGDPDPGTTESIVTIPPPGGDVRSGRPKVRATYPSGSGWPLTVPVVVEFNESVNEESIAPTTTAGNDGRIVLRARGNPTAIPCDYQFLAEGRLLVMRPLSSLTNTGTPTYEVVLLPDARDADGVRFEVPEGGTVLSEFQVNQDEELVDGRILALYPRENVRDFPREGDLYIVFDRQAVTSTFTGNLQLQQSGGPPVAGTVLPAIVTVNVPDGRVAKFDPTGPLDASTEYELVVTDGVKFGSEGELDFRGRTPFSRFETVAPAAPASVALRNSAPGFDNKINIGNAESAVLRVVPPDDALAGDRVKVRVYGGDATTSGVGDLGFVERFAELTQNGNTPVDVDLAGAFGSLANPDFDEGVLTFTAQMQRGSETSGFIHNAGAAEAMFDITAPSVTRVGAPAAGNGNDVWTDTEHVAVWGQASEEIASAELTIGAAPPGALFASDEDGVFLMRPVLLGRLTDPVAYTLTVVDLAGNMTTTPFGGSVAQRGVVTGTLGSQLVVEAYDQATLAPIAGATVLVDPGVPVVPASGRSTAATGAAGRALFAPPPATSHTITIVAPGYHLVTLYDSPAAFVSLPLRPIANATATLTGEVDLPQGAAVTAVVGSTAVADRGVLGTRTLSTAPEAIPAIPITPNRPQIVTAYAGPADPTANPTFVAHGAQVLGRSLTDPTPSPAAPAGGASGEISFDLILALAQTTAVPAWQRDFGTATGLDLGTLVGGEPSVRVMAPLAAFEGQALLGVGFSSAPTGTTYPIEGSFSAPIAAGLAPFSPGALVLVAAEAQDGSGRISRSRGLPTVVAGFPVVVALQPVPPLPVVTTPSSPSNGSPEVRYFDGIGTEALTTFDITATDASGRQWVMYVQDADMIAGVDVAQFPDVAAGTGLATGAWTVRVEGRQWITQTAMTAADFVLTERVRLEIEYSRATPVTFTVQ